MEAMKVDGGLWMTPRGYGIVDVEVNQDAYSLCLLYFLRSLIPCGLKAEKEGTPDICFQGARSGKEQWFDQITGVRAPYRI